MMLHTFFTRWRGKSFSSELVEEYGIDAVRKIPKCVYQSPHHNVKDYLDLKNAIGEKAIRINSENDITEWRIKPYFIDPTAVKTSNAMPAENDFLVNYVWITQAPIDPHQDTRRLSHWELNTLLNNAQRYPDAQFQLWLDHETEPAETLSDIETIIDDNGIKNLLIRNLHDIDNYHDLAYSDVGIWTCVDMVRMLVTDHELKNSSRAQVIYSDFDISDVDIGKKDVQKWLSAIGFVPGISIAHEGHDIKIENSYFAVSKEAKEPFHFMTSAMIDAARANKPLWIDYTASVGNIVKPDIQKACSVMWHGTGKIVQSMGWQPDHVSYQRYDLKAFCKP